MLHHRGRKVNDEYVKKLITLSRDIEKKTKEAIKNVKPTKFELLDKAILKINSSYDELLDSIKGEYYNIKLDLDNKKYELVLISNYSVYSSNNKEKSRCAYIEQQGYSYNTCYILNGNTFGPCRRIYDEDSYPGSYYSQYLKTDDNKYYTCIIEIVTKHHDEIQEKIKKHIEDIVTKRNLENTNRISNEISLINALECFINN